ncbi:beta strand repeat-containing protein [Deinococcus arboris]|uniref:beta strand repeat-containing protein n=1 Tax=Deinococcus arboris TaxID=2682977 RepID=UPI0018DE40A7
MKNAYLYWFASKAAGTAVDNTVTFTVNGTASTVTANRTWTGAFDNADMGAVADITNLVSATPNATMEMDGLNIQINSANCQYVTVHGGWALYIVYENPGLSSKRISFYDGLNYIYTTTTADINATNFKVPNAPTFDKVTKLTVAAMDGDPATGATNDILQIRPGTTGTRTSLSSTNRTATDIYTGLVTVEAEDGTEVIQGGSSKTGTTNTGGLDIATFNVSSLIPADTTTINAFSSSNGGEQVNLYNVILMANTTDANVRLVKTIEGGATTLTNGDSLKYILTVDNAQGVTEALNVVTVDTLPQGLTYNSTEISYDGGTSWATLAGVTTSVSGGVTTITTPAVRRIDPDGKVWGGTNAIATQLGTQNVRYRITATANGAAFGSVTNTATATSGVTETTTVADNTGTRAVTINRRADLAITKDDGATTVNPNGTTSYTIRVTNNGPDSVTGAVLKDLVASGLSKTAVVCSTTPGQCTAGTTPTPAQLEGATGYALPALASGQFYELRVTASITATSGTVTNTATVDTPSGAVDPSPSNNSASDADTVNLVADLAITKTGPASAFQGATVTYIIRARNNGPSAVTGATIADTVPASLTNVSWTCAGTGTATCATASGTGNSISLGANLPVDTGNVNYVTLTVTGTASTNGTVTNTATIAAPAGVTDSPTTNNTSTAAFPVTAQVTCTNLYALVGGDFSGSTANNGNEIRAVGDTTNVLGDLITTVPNTGTGTAGFSATLAIKAGGTKFFVVRDTDSRLLSYDVATNTWTEGQALPTPTGRYVRMAVTSNDVGYVMDGGGNLYSFTTTATPTYTALPALTRLPATAPTLGASGDFFADNRGNLFLLSSTGTDGFLDFWEIETANNNLIYLGRLSDADIVGTYGGFGATPNGLFGRGGSGRMINVDLRAFTATPVGTANNGATDLASCTFPSLTRTISAIKTATRVGGGTTVQPGDTLEYTITVKNTGTVAAGNTQFLDQIPAGTTYVAGTTTLNGTAVADATGGVMPYTQSGQSINSPGQQVGSLLVDQTPADTTDREAIIKFRVTVNTANPPTQVSNQGTVSTRDNGAVLTAVTDDPATATANDATVTTVTPVAVLDLAITKAGPAFAKAGEAFAYTITVTNTTATPATTVTVTDVLPTGLTFVSATNSGSYNAGTRTVTWTLASVAGNASTVLTLNVTAPAAATISPAAGVKSAQNTASLSATGDTNAANNTSAPVTTRFVLNEITKRVRNVTTNSAFGTSGGGKPGEVLEYCLDTTNLGGADLPGYALTDQVPGNVNALTTAYDADEPTTATGFGVRVARTTAGVTTTTYRTSVADADTGTLTTTGGTFSRGTMTLGLGTLLAGESVTACFQATIR